MDRQKIVFLGGGSPFVPSLIQAIIENKDALSGSEVCLMDIDPTRLPKLAKLGEVMARRSDMDLAFSHTTDPRVAMDEATFVFPGYRIGGSQALSYDMEIPTRHGICGDETAGPGGTFMAQCTIPATLAHCKIMEELCPDAWAISYVNPTNFVADAVRRESPIRFIAICDCFPGFKTGLADWLGVSPDALKARAVGVNHNTWLTDLLVNGEDGYSLLREQPVPKEQEAAAAEGTPLERVMQEVGAFDKALLETYGYLNVCAYHCQMYWDHGAAMEIRSSRAIEESILGWSPSALEFVDQMLAGAPYDAERPEYCFSMHHSRHAVGIMVSIITNDGREWGGINFPNDGAISNLPLGAILEGPCIVDARGPVPIAMGELPKPFVGLTQHLINWQELTVDAALSGDKGILYQALLASPYVHDMKAARAIMDELLVAHAPYMPQFAA
jgi:6-phospho-beta-glucosidase